MAGVLFEATVGATAGSAAGGFARHDFHLGHAWPTLGWLVLLALTSQVLGWLLITVSMPRLPAGMIGALLLVQPGTAGTVEAMGRSGTAGTAGGGRPGWLVAAEYEDHAPRSHRVEGQVGVEVPVAGDDGKPPG